MTHIAVMGATSHIAQDYIRNLAKDTKMEGSLFSRNPEKIMHGLIRDGLSKRFACMDYKYFSFNRFDAIINFIGVGDAARMAEMGAEILDVTYKFDDMAIEYIRKNSSCRYLFLSAGGVYGGTFPEPASETTPAILHINNVVKQEFYIVAKLYAEYRHRGLPNLPIYDIRVFNYFSRTKLLEENYFICILLRAILNKTTLKVKNVPLVRDYLHPEDFYNLTKCLMSSDSANVAVDCYTKEPVQMEQLLKNMKLKFGLSYEMVDVFEDQYRDFTKNYYYSINHYAKNFGYVPNYSSLENLMMESEFIIESKSLSKQRELTELGEH